MDFLGLFRRETDEQELSMNARRLLGAVRSGKNPEEAAREANVSAEDLRRWMREPTFRAALRREPAPATVIDLRDVERGMIERSELPGGDPTAPPPPGSSEREISQQGWRKL